VSSETAATAAAIAASQYLPSSHLGDSSRSAMRGEEGVTDNFQGITRNCNGKWLRFRAGFTLYMATIIEIYSVKPTGVRIARARGHGGCPPGPLG
jgi:hypothetical protein